MTPSKLLEAALERIDSLSDAEFSQLTKEIIRESSVVKEKADPVSSSHISIGYSYQKRLIFSLYNCLMEEPAANDTNLAEAA